MDNSEEKVSFLCGPLVSRIYLAAFDFKRGYEISWSRTIHNKNNSPDSVEGGDAISDDILAYKSLPSGIHNYAIHTTNYSVLKDNIIENENENEIENNVSDFDNQHENQEFFETILEAVEPPKDLVYFIHGSYTVLAVFALIQMPSDANESSNSNSNSNSNSQANTFNSHNDLRGNFRIVSLGLLVPLNTSNSSKFSNSGSNLQNVWIFVEKLRSVLNNYSLKVQKGESGNDVLENFYNYISNLKSSKQYSNTQKNDNSSSTLLSNSSLHYSDDSPLSPFASPRSSTIQISSPNTSNSQSLKNKLKPPILINSFSNPLQNDSQYVPSYLLNPPKIPRHHPALSITHYLHALGPLAFTVWKAALLRKKILFVCEMGSQNTFLQSSSNSHTPSNSINPQKNFDKQNFQKYDTLNCTGIIEQACGFVYDTYVIGNLPEEILKSVRFDRGKLNPFYSIGLRDIIPRPVTQNDSYQMTSSTYNHNPSPSNSSPAPRRFQLIQSQNYQEGWVACTTDRLLAHKLGLADVIVHIPVQLLQPHFPLFSPQYLPLPPLKPITAQKCTFFMVNNKPLTRTCLDFVKSITSSCEINTNAIFSSHTPTNDGTNNDDNNNSNSGPNHLPELDSSVESNSSPISSSSHSVTSDMNYIHWIWKKISMRPTYRDLSRFEFLTNKLARYYPYITKELSPLSGFSQSSTDSNQNESLSDKFQSWFNGPTKTVDKENTNNYLNVSFVKYESPRWSEVIWSSFLWWASAGEGVRMQDDYDDEMFPLIDSFADNHSRNTNDNKNNNDYNNDDPTYEYETNIDVNHLRHDDIDSSASEPLLKHNKNNLNINTKTKTQHKSLPTIKLNKPVNALDFNQDKVTIVTYFHRLTYRLFKTLEDIISRTKPDNTNGLQSSNEAANSFETPHTSDSRQNFMGINRITITRNDMLEMGLDPGAESDWEFIVELVSLWYGIEVTTEKSLSALFAGIFCTSFKTF